ncbi:hypothetical protein R3P38DRAFT_3044824 [Favolaschia claudopus]|uniref:Uncharacterized protein n=1 Tax=Favolaschia claudopus TaxID=2862362 RepID=A0AAW0A6G6_9AGAR
MATTKSTFLAMEKRRHGHRLYSTCYMLSLKKLGAERVSAYTNTLSNFRTLIYSKYLPGCPALSLELVSHLSCSGPPSPMTEKSLRMRMQRQRSSWVPGAQGHRKPRYPLQRVIILRPSHRTHHQECGSPHAILARHGCQPNTRRLHIRNRRRTRKSHNGWHNGWAHARQDTRRHVHFGAGRHWAAHDGDKADLAMQWRTTWRRHRLHSTCYMLSLKKLGAPACINHL